MNVCSVIFRLKISRCLRGILLNHNGLDPIRAICRSFCIASPYSCILQDIFFRYPPWFTPPTFSGLEPAEKGGHGVAGLVNAANGDVPRVIEPASFCMGGTPGLKAQG